MEKIVPYAGVNSILIDEKGRILLTRRAKHINLPGRWCLPGGTIEGGEDWIGAMRRETAEEIGLRVLEEELIGIYSDPGLTTSEEPLRSGHYGQFLVALFRVLRYEGGIRPNEEVDAWDWFAPDALPEPMVRSTPIRIQDAVAFKGKVFVR